ncbi:porin [Pararobbsia alpina]|uniref:Outer membrane porin protein n=1 Tax=Pararobbsia alpina TaxID=621374 RepID=A0A6S7B5X7_9BURK|nr:porin [Pararobbsia alpina]CAB3780516.1 Outer membrane porin protein [Pararobbsia alpina]
MKKSLITLAVLGTAATAAQAQSSVTLYGLIDAGVTYVNSTKTATGGHSLVAMQDGATAGLSGSRWGVRGQEDLGGGSSAIFVLESGFSYNTGASGQGGALFGRQAFVGLSNTTYGVVTLGRQYDTGVDLLQPLAAYGTWGNLTSHAGDIDNIGNLNRINNAVKYTSATYSGFKVTGMYSLGGVAGDVTRNSLYSLGASYAMGPVKLAADYLYAKDPNSGFFAMNPGQVSTVNNFGSTHTAYSGFSTAGGEQIIAAGGNYVFGPATLGLIYSNVRFNNLGGNPNGTTNTFQNGADASFNDVEANVKYQFTPALIGGFSYNYTKGNSITTVSGIETGATYNQFNLGVDYLLSKRTDVYLLGIYQHASGVDSTGQRAVAAITGETQSTTPNQLALTTGLRTRF